METIGENKFIKIDNVKIQKKRILISEISYSKNLGKYFSSNRFYIKYDEDILTDDKGILNIPALSEIIIFSWLMGADIHVDRLDRSYLESLDRVKKFYQSCFPKFSFKGNVYVDEIGDNKFSDRQYGMLFSGGLDCLCSYIRNRDRNLRLVTIIGGIIQPDKKPS